MTRTELIDALDLVYPEKVFLISPDFEDIPTPYFVVSKISGDYLYSFGYTESAKDDAFQIDLYTNPNDISEDIDSITEVVNGVMYGLGLRVLGGSGIDSWEEESNHYVTTLRFGGIN